MVKISPLKPYLPKKPEEFTTNPYDVIEKEEEKKLKLNPNSLIHLILPDGNGEEIYENAAKAYQRYKDEKVIVKENQPSIFVYRQESEFFSHQGLIMGISLQDYETGNIVKHEHTRDKPLKDRTNHIVSTKVVAGLVWNVFSANKKINKIIEKIKKKDPIFNFSKNDYKHILWQETDTRIIENLTQLFKNEKVYIADGHHRAASAAEYRKKQLTRIDKEEDLEESWQYLLSYVASDDQIRILPYNRVIKKLPMKLEDFLKNLGEIYEIKQKDKAFDPEKKNQVAMCLKGKWYELNVKDKDFKSKRDSLDVVILQDKVLNPILGITDPRADENIFFVGGIKNPHDMEKYITEKGNDIFFNLYPVNIKDLEAIADLGGVMPPKSTWFDPKVLSGLILHDLRTN
ncbi:MAG: DUF1015 domain-containing protein [Promethearchaeota archaeon]